MTRPRLIRLWMPIDSKRARKRGWVDCSLADLRARHAGAVDAARAAGVPVEIVKASCADLAAAAQALGVDPDTPDGRAAAVAAMPSSSGSARWCKGCRVQLADEGRTRCRACADTRAAAKRTT